MTVCIAARCQHNGAPYIVGAADRMATSDDIEFASPQAKIQKVSNSVAVLTSGSIDPHTYALGKTRLHFKDSAAPTVDEITRYYAASINEFRREHAALQAFGELGLTIDSFIEKQSSMLPNIATSLLVAFQSHWITCQALVCGSDINGVHIMAIDNKGSVASRNDIGFDAIGSGARHANSQFMFARHSQDNTLVDTLFLAYLSKKFAEAAPGVGPDTDLFFVSGSGTLSSFTPETKQVLDATYSAYRGGVETAENAARKATSDHLIQLWSA